MQQNKIEAAPLSYDYGALEPFIDRETMELHHGKHMKTYAEKTQTALAKHPHLQERSLAELLKDPNLLPEDIRKEVKNNGGGVYNHTLFFALLKPHEEDKCQPVGRLFEKINETFGSFEAFKEKFSKAATELFGSGYLWLARDAAGALHIIQTVNQDTLLPTEYCPAAVIDLWEHSYYLKHKNKREGYISDWFHVVNWEQAEAYYTHTASKASHF